MIIAIAHSKGGVGKSTIAFNIAVELSKEFEVELIDLDFQGTTTYANVFRAKSGLKSLNVLNFTNIEEIKTYIQNDSDEKIAVIDIGGFDSESNRIIILTADMVITPVSASGRELLGLKHFENILSSMSEKIKNTIVVSILLNNVNPKKQNLDKLKQHISKSKHFSLLKSILRKRVDFDYSMDSGMSVIEFNKTGKASGEMKNLLTEIKMIIKGL